MDYENKSNWTLGQSKPNSNPISERVKLMQSVYLQRIMKKNAALGYEKTKPKQTQFLQRPKMNINIYYTKVYDNVTAFRLQKNKPKQTQSLVKDLIALVSAWMFISKTAKNSFAGVLLVLSSTV